MTKLGNNENVTMEVMAKICNTLDCKIDYGDQGAGTGRKFDSIPGNA